MKVPQAVKTKCVMGELTLGDVLNLINSRFSYICVVQDGVSGRYDNWCVNAQLPDKKSKLLLYRDENTQDYDHDFSFDLKSKVSIKSDSVEWEEDGLKTCLQFLETKVIGLDEILPRRNR